MKKIVPTVPVLQGGNLPRTRRTLQKLAKYANIYDRISGVANEIDITDDGDSTITVGIVNPLIVAKGGTGLATITDHGIMLGSGTGAVTPLGVATNGQLPIGSTGADPTLATLTDTANQITVTNGAGSITLSIPDPFAIPGKLTAGSFSSPLDVTNTREYGFEIHYSGNNYNVTGLRSRASLITTDTTANARGANIQAANSDGINAGTLTGLNVEALGKSTTTAATIADLIGIHINTEWESNDTVIDMTTLWLRCVSESTAPTGTSYGLEIYNQQKGAGNNCAFNAAIKIHTNIPSGTAWDYGIDIYDAANSSQIGTADIRLQNGETISNSTDGTIAFSEDISATNLVLTGTLTVPSYDFTFLTDIQWDETKLQYKNRTMTNGSLGAESGWVDVPTN